VLSAIKFMHSRGYVHRDLKMENIMIENPDSEFPMVKLIDFGTA